MEALNDFFDKISKKIDDAWMLEQVEKSFLGIVETKNKIEQIREKLINMLLTKQSDAVCTQ